MININVPERCTYPIENIVFDYNGTIAVNGSISSSTREKISLLCDMANIYVLTADTYGSAAKECEGLNLKLKTFPKGDAADFKAKIVNKYKCFNCSIEGIKPPHSMVQKIRLPMHKRLMRMYFQHIITPVFIDNLFPLKYYLIIELLFIN